MFFLANMTLSLDQPRMRAEQQRMGRQIWGDRKVQLKEMGVRLERDTK